MEAMKVAIEFYKPVVRLSHRHHVMGMYRRALRECFNYAESRDLFIGAAEKVRERFDANMHLNPDSPVVKRLIQEGEEELKRKAHPDPYVNPHMPGGTSFMRNPAIPLEVVFPDGIPEGYSRRRINVDFSNIPDDQPDADKVFVDFVNKKYWIDRKP